MPLLDERGQPCDGDLHFRDNQSGSMFEKEIPVRLGAKFEKSQHHALRD